MGKGDSARSTGSNLDVNILLAANVLFIILARVYINRFESTVISEIYTTYPSFEAFYPFYLSQHQDTVCRILHCCGSSVILLTALLEPSIFLSLVLGGCAGAAMLPVSGHFKQGLIEMAVMLSTFLLCMKKITGKWWKGFAVLTVGYGFAWVGHFIFELNRPATFLYPLFSLLGDFRLWFDIVSQSIMSKVVSASP